jgi:hypothetical protein
VNATQNKLIEDLRLSSIRLGHSPQRREVPYLALKCYKHFGSFNIAKTKAGLEIKNVRFDKFPKNAFRQDKDLAAIISYITFDGHLYKTFKGLYYSSKNVEDLKRFEEVMTRKFGLQAHYKLFNSGSYKQTHMIYFFNKKICEFLFRKGLPKGDKAIQRFDVPMWIVNSREFSREFSREYLKIAYLCEGSIKEEKEREPRITFTQAKHFDVLDSGLNFMSTLKEMLTQFKIESGEIYVSAPRVRKKDNKFMNDLRFRIKVKDNNRFISEIGWFK